LGEGTGDIAVDPVPVSDNFKHDLHLLDATGARCPCVVPRQYLLSECAVSFIQGKFP